jgi:uncharacterized protein involved in exopolysaccharide biosynthesis
MPSEIVKYTPTHDSSMTMSFRSGVESFFRQRRLFTVVAIGVIAATAVVTLLMHRQYVSEMKFLVQNARQNVVLTPERTNGNFVNEITETQVNSEIEILRSHDVMDPVADPEWQKLKPEQRDEAAKRLHEGRLAAFDKRLTTEPVRKTNVISVTLRASSPDEARESLQKLSDAYLAQHRRMQRPAGASEFFAAEAERYRKAWDEASAKLVEFQQRYQVNSLAQRETDVADQLNKLQADVLTSDASLHELDARMLEGSRRLKDLSVRRTTQQTRMPRLQSIQQLSTLVVELENKRTTLLSNYKPEDRQVRELDKQLESTRAALNEAANVSSEQVTTDVDPLWQQVRTDLAQSNIARRATAAHHAAVSAQMDALKKDLGQMQDLNVQYNNLDAQVKEQRQNYELYAEKRDQSQIADAMDQRGLMNVVVAQEPTLPFSPARPKPLLNAMLGIVTAMFLGFCAIYLAETGRNTLATPRELDATSRYPILATVAMANARGYITEPGALEGGRNLASVIVHTTRQPDVSYQR